MIKNLKKCLKTTSALAVSLSLLFTGLPVYSQVASDEELYDAAVSMGNMFLLGSSGYYDSRTYGARDYTVPELYEAALKAIADELDEYSTYMTDEEAAKNFGDNYGVGVALTKTDGAINITKVIEDSPAEEAGVAVGDKIKSVNGRSVSNLEALDVLDLLYGELDEKVNVTVTRDEKDINFTLTFSDFYINTVVCMSGADFRDSAKNASIPNNCGYIAMHELSDTSEDDFLFAAKELANKGVTKLILDLRGLNSGGVDFAITISEALVPNFGTAFTLALGNNVSYPVSMPGDELFEKVVVLTDENTGRAAELIASAVQSSKIGAAVGKKTKGNAVYSDIIELSFGGYFIYTRGVYYDANDVMISYNGVTPNVLVKPFTVSGNDTREVVMSLRQAMYSLGYSKTARLSAEETESALIAFQKDNKLEETGALNKETTNKINSTLKTYFSGSRCIFETGLRYLLEK